MKLIQSQLYLPDEDWMNDTLVVFSNMYFDNTTTTNFTAIYEVNDGTTKYLLYKYKDVV